MISKRHHGTFRSCLGPVLQPVTRSNGTEERSELDYFGWLKLDVGTGRNDAIHLDPWFPPDETPSIPLGGSLVPTPCRVGGSRVYGRISKKKKLVKRKQPPFAALVKRIVKYQTDNQDLHVRKYIVGERWPHSTGASTVCTRLITSSAKNAAKWTYDNLSTGRRSLDC